MLTKAEAKKTKITTITPYTDPQMSNKGRLPPEVNRVLYVRNLPYKITSASLYEIFGRYGPIRQVRLGTAPDTKGTAFVVFEDIYDAREAVDHLSGFNVQGRYLVCLYYQQKNLGTTSSSVEEKKREIEVLKKHTEALEKE